MKSLFCIIYAFCFSFLTWGQDKNNFEFINPKKKSQKVKFTTINNLIIIELEVNGVPTNFLVDTGFSKTLLFSLEDPNVLNTKLLNRVRIKGFGGEETLYAYESKGNQLSTKGIINKSASLFLFFDNEYNLTNQLGVNVHGIIGYDLFKNFVVKVNYENNYLKFYHPNTFKRKLRRYKKKKLSFYKDKPYIQLTTTDKSVVSDSIKVLIDTGSSDALWLMKNKNITEKEPHFNDVIGYGLMGIIEGKRSRLQTINFETYSIPNVNIAYPDSLYYSFIDEIKERDGIIGGELLRRFTWFFDYPNQEVYFHPNRNIDDPFVYDMSGIVLKYDGYDVIQKRITQPIRINGQDANGNLRKSQSEQVNFRLEVVNRLIIASIRPNSPAADAGLLPNDEILTINGQPAFEKKLDEMSKILSSGHKDRVNLGIKRDAAIFTIQLELQDRLFQLEN